MKAEQKEDTRPPVRVIATSKGHDGVKIREEGDIFTVPAAVFDKRPRIDTDRDGNPVNKGHYDPPSWFEEAVEEVATERKVVGKSKAKGGEDLT